MKVGRLVAFGVGLALLLGGGGARAGEISVVVSIKPIHSLVAAVMQGVGEPKLIVEGAGSPHSYAMRPSQAAALEHADIVFWIGPDLEHFLVGPLDTLASGAKLVTLEKVPGLTILLPREGGAFEAEAEEGHDHARETIDPHLWLDPQNAKMMVATIDDALSSADPAHSQGFHANARGLKDRLGKLEAETRDTLAPVREEPFVVFHDAYQYFEKRFGLSAAGSVTVDPQAMPGAARLEAIRAKLSRLDTACVFSEPQFRSQLVDVVTEGTRARTGVLDPLGAGLANGPDLYFRLVGDLASSLKTCLAGAR